MEKNTIFRSPWPGNKKKAVEDLDKIYIGSVTGAQIPLKQLANIEFQDSPSLIEHYKREKEHNH